MCKQAFLSLVITVAVLISFSTADADIILSENFEGIGEGNFSNQAGRYDVNNGFNDRSDFWAVEGPGSNPAGPANNGGDLFGGSNLRAFGGRDLDGGASNPGGTKSIDLIAVDTTNYANLVFSMDFYGDTSSNINAFGSSNTIQVLLDYDNNGSFDETLLTIRGSGASNTSLISDADSASLTTYATFVTTSAPIIAPTTDLVIRIQASSNIGNRFVFDNITLEGDPAAGPIPEPATAGMLGLAGLALLRRRRVG